MPAISAGVLGTFIEYIHYHHDSIPETFLDTEVALFIINLFVFAYNSDSIAMGQSISAAVDELQKDAQKEKLVNDAMNSLIELAVSRVYLAAVFMS